MLNISFSIIEKPEINPQKDFESFVLILPGFSPLANFRIQKLFSSEKFSTGIHSASNIL